MSQVADQQADVETAVRNRTQYHNTLHRQDPDADEPRPACAEGDYRDDADFKEVDVAAYPTYDRCQNPECFGERWW